MKRTDGFDARRLRPRQQRSWGSRLAAALGLLLMLGGVLLAASGAGSLLSDHAFIASLALDREASITLLVTGLVLLTLGLLIRRSVRRRSHAPGGLSMSRRLSKRR